MPRLTSWERIAKADGKKEGKLEGKLEAKEETAKALLKRGVDIDIIVDATGFTREEIEKMVETVH